MGDSKAMSEQAKALDIFDARMQLAGEIAEVRITHARYFGPERPFYWSKVHDDPSISAPSGWYQWTERGLIYLGESILVKP